MKFFTWVLFATTFQQCSLNNLRSESSWERMKSVRKSESETERAKGSVKKPNGKRMWLLQCWDTMLHLSRSHGNLRAELLLFYATPLYSTHCPLPTVHCEWAWPASIQLQQLHLQVTCNCFLRMRNFLINAACRSHKSWRSTLAWRLQATLPNVHLLLLLRANRDQVPFASCRETCHDASCKLHWKLSVINGCGRRRETCQIESPYLGKSG